MDCIGQLEMIAIHRKPVDLRVVNLEQIDDHYIKKKIKIFEENVGSNHTVGHVKNSDGGYGLSSYDSSSHEFILMETLDGMKLCKKPDNNTVLDLDSCVIACGENEIIFPEAIPQISLNKKLKFDIAFISSLWDATPRTLRKLKDLFFGSFGESDTVINIARIVIFFDPPGELSIEGIEFQCRLINTFLSELSKTIPIDIITSGVGKELFPCMENSETISVYKSPLFVELSGGLTLAIVLNWSPSPNQLRCGILQSALFTKWILTTSPHVVIYSDEVQSFSSESNSQTKFVRVPSLSDPLIVLVGYDASVKTIPLDFGS